MPKTYTGPTPPPPPRDPLLERLIALMADKAVPR